MLLQMRNFRVADAHVSVFMGCQDLPGMQSRSAAGSHMRTDNGESVGYEFLIETRRLVEDPVPVRRFHGG